MYIIYSILIHLYSNRLADTGQGYQRLQSCPNVRAEVREVGGIVYCVHVIYDLVIAFDRNQGLYAILYYYCAFALL